MNKNKKLRLLNMSSFYGLKNDVINEYIKYLKNIRNKKNLDCLQKDLLQIYMEKLNEYKNISDTTTPEFQKFIEHINEEYVYLQKKFPHIPIEFQGRIKSLLGADSKIKKDLKAAIISNEPLDSISMKDILAYRYILNIPENLSLDENEVIKICYDVLTAQIEFNLQKNHELLEAKHIFSSNLENLEEKAKENHIFIPSSNFENEYSKYIKDYIKNPKDSLYQALHVRYLISGIPFETQIKTRQMHEFAEFGGASHRYYKPRSTFNIHNVPQELGIIRKNDKYEIDLLSMDESIKLYYGYEFADRFGVSFDEFRKNYSLEDRIKILKGNLVISENGTLIPASLNFSKIRLKKSDVSLSELINMKENVQVI